MDVIILLIQFLWTCPHSFLIKLQRRQGERKGRELSEKEEVEITASIKLSVIDAIAKAKSLLSKAYQY